MAKRQTLAEELARIDLALRDIDEKEALLATLAHDADHDELRDAGADGSSGSQPASERDAGGEGRRLLRGPEIRRVAVAILRVPGQQSTALHYREWLRRVEAEGYAIAGKNPEAVFLSQVSRSPVVRKTTRPGEYELDVMAPARLRSELGRLREQLARLAGAPLDVGANDPAEERNAVNLRISQTERALAEAEAAFADGGMSASIRSAA